MAIFTASQATTAVSALTLSTAELAHQELIARYQGIFDLIETASGEGRTSVTWNLTKNSYLEILTDLQVAGYTVSSWPSGITDPSKSSTITISWPAAVVTPTVYPSMIGILPTILAGQQNVYFKAVFAASGGVGPYTYTIAGDIPTGLSWSTLTNVNTITLSGTPLAAANEYNALIITATDTVGQSISQRVTWDIANSTVLTVITNTPGTQSLSYSAATSQITFTPYLLPATTTSTLGAVIIPSVVTSGINNSSGTLTLATASTTQLGALKVDGTSIQVTDGVASIPSTTTVLDQRIRSIAIASAVAFGV